jgi:opacity protein-like surface antigen
MFGVLALWLMAVMTWPRFFRAGPRSSKVYSASLTAWAVMFMAYGGMRFGAVGFLFGLGAAGVLTKRDLLIHTLQQYQRESTWSYLEQNARPSEAV